MRRVLCVGEDQPLWQEIRNHPAGFAEQWAAEFAQTGPEALAWAEQGDFDAVVADVQLFDMSGVELLDTILRRQPRAIRILLSEQFDLVNTVKCIGRAHHHLLKPCDADMLLEALNQGISAESWVPAQRVQDLLAKMRWIPSPPSIYFRIALEMDSPGASVETIGQIIRQDPPTTAKVLQLANSAVFGLHLQVNEPAEAVAYLGLEATRTLVLLAHTFSEFEKLPGAHFSIDALWYHSVLVGQFARQITVMEKQAADVAEQSYAGGLLHDLGKILFAANLPGPFGEAVKIAHEKHLQLAQTETELLGANHAELGASLLAIWGLPQPIVEAVAFHHQPAECVRESFGPVTAVHAANVLAYEAGSADDTSPPEFDQAYLRKLGLLDHIEPWRGYCGELDPRAAC